MVYMTGRAAVDLDQLSTVTMLVNLKTLIAHIAKILTLDLVKERVVRIYL